ncbi:hypothetical protein HELRODRAFT_164187 [Helobdella robusta]|uniref:Uncharacterized protein n=1 Tax=Helobdella robusta TaxID=6412 RepID=T1EV26_HELRO|nr:hypothetical protein HELRODRAFT_164187 [Helobdella robusta]ESN94358.1 hypothetical protein HELRODRAFT_164187 [Helobdella robusta]
MDQLRLEFAVLPASDGKSNIYCVTSITTRDEKVFAIPEELQSASFHKELIKTAAYNKIKNSLKKRHQTRKIWITMTNELSNVYIDEDGNLQFGDQYLEEIEQKKASGNLVKNTDSLEKLFTKFIESSQDLKKQNLKYIAEKFIIERFTSKNTNPSQWIDVFEKECLRFDITEDEKKIEILRLFMDKSCADWYSSMIIKLTLNSEWSIWKNKFCESFANQGWNQVTYALLFKYKDGSLVDYAIKKEKLLLDMRTSIDTGTLVDLIAAGLPGFVLEKINRQSMEDTVDLFNEVRKYEHLMNKNKNGTYTRYENQKIHNKIEERTACKICERLNKEIYGVYDSGSNVSLINSKLLKLKNENNNVNEQNLVTINGVKKTCGLTKLKIKIFEIEEKVDVYIIDDAHFRYDFLIGLDMIKTYKKKKFRSRLFKPKPRVGTRRKYRRSIKNATILPNELSEDCIHSDWIRDKERALNNTLKSHYYSKMCYDAKRKNREFKVGDMVYVENGNKLNRKKTRTTNRTI